MAVALSFKPIVGAGADSSNAGGGAEVQGSTSGLDILDASCIISTEACYKKVSNTIFHQGDLSGLSANNHIMILTDWSNMLKL